MDLPKNLRNELIFLVAGFLSIFIVPSIFTSTSFIFSLLAQVILLIGIVRIPIWLHQLGFYAWLNKNSSVARKIGEFLGSKEPSVFYKNVFQLVFFIFLFSLFATDFNVKAQLANVYGYQIYEVQACVQKQEYPVIYCVKTYEEYDTQTKANYVGGRHPFSPKNQSGIFFDINNLTGWNKSIPEEAVAKLNNSNFSVYSMNYSNKRATNPNWNSSDYVYV